jgi:hypothetical protein
MPLPTPLTEVVVSVQDAGPGHEHLATGLLGDRDLVLVPRMPERLLGADREFHVVTIPRPLDAGFPVERLQALCTNVMWIRDRRDGPVAAMLKLRLPSGYSPTMGPFDGATLAAELERTGGEVWPALESLRIVRPGAADGPTPDELAALPEIERRQRLATYREHEYRNASDIGWSICRWLCICRPTSDT